ncbi:MAG: sulfite exporter TauE/SafE family protein [Rickettsiales bacterium]|nr:sulfite exporter TauE/SafE family protein [Rickettsiales bacterium]
MTLLDAFLYFAVALAGGAINSVAGGGTFLTFPMLILNGLSPFTANIVSSIALWPGAVASAYAYRHQRVVEKKPMIVLSLASLIGSAAGAWILLASPETTFEFLVPWLMLLATLIFTFGKHGIALFDLGGHQVSNARLWAGFTLQCIIALYGGYFGAGMGIMMLAMLQVMGFTDIHRMNALKTVLGTLINAVAVFIFIFSDKVVWPVAGVMVVGAIIGGYVGARLALRVSPKKVRWFVSIIAFSMTAYFFINGV